jgi:nucleoside-diphosphate-sugar epimerase
MSEIRGRAILVTGGLGAIGSNLTNRLSSDNRIIVVDNSSSGSADNLVLRGSVKLYRNDIRDEEVLEEVFTNEKPDIVYHLAANFANQNSVDHPFLDLDVNGRGTLLLLEKAARFRVARFVYASTSGVYGKEFSRMTEDSTGVLETPYYIHKKLGEDYATYFFHQYGLPVTTVRLFNSYGPGEMWGKYRNVIPNFFFQALKGESLTITGTGEETRDFTYVADVVEGLIKCATAENAVAETFNLGTGKETRILDLAELINEVCQNKAEIQFTPRRRWDAVERRCAVVDKARQLLGWTAQIDLKEGISKYYAWARRRYDDIHPNAGV